MAFSCNSGLQGKSGDLSQGSIWLPSKESVHKRAFFSLEKSGPHACSTASNDSTPIAIKCCAKSSCRFLSLRTVYSISSDICVSYGNSGVTEVVRLLRFFRPI
jgi:hypothetical protein